MRQCWIWFTIRQEIATSETVWEWGSTASTAVDVEKKGREKYQLWMRYQIPF